MTFQPGYAAYTQGFGTAPAGVSFPYYSSVAPSTTSTQGNFGPFQIGQRWIVPNTGEWVLLGLSTSGGALTANWQESVSSTGDVLSVTGTANQILANPTTGNVVLSLIGPYTPATYTAHGVLIGEGTSSIAATAAGSAGQVLTSGGASADPAWTTATFPSTATAGALIAATATNVIGQIADVATGQALMSGGVGVIPAYSGSPSFSGSVTAATTITATLGNITATNGNFVGSTAGTGLQFNANTATGAAASPVVLNSRAGQVIFTSVSIAAAADLTLTITNSAVTASTTQIIYSMSGATTGSALSIKSVTNSSGSSAIVVTNGTGATTTTANITLNFIVVN